MKLKKPIKSNNTNLEFILISIVQDVHECYWIKALMTNSNNEALLNVYAKSVALVNKQPTVYFYAENKLIRKYYAVCSDARFLRVKFEIASYTIDSDARGNEPAVIMAYPHENCPEVTIVPNYRG